MRGNAIEVLREAGDHLGGGGGVLPDVAKHVFACEEDLPSQEQPAQLSPLRRGETVFGEDGFVVGGIGPAPGQGTRAFQQLPGRGFDGRELLLDEAGDDFLRQAPGGVAAFHAVIRYHLEAVDEIGGGKARGGA